MTTRSPDAIRAGVLDRMERHDRALKRAIVAAAVAEALLLGLALWLTNLHDRTQALILVTSVLSYTIIVLGLVALGAYTSRSIGALAAALTDRPSS